MKRTESGLFIAANFNFLRRHGRDRWTEKVVTLPTGERVRRLRNDARTAYQIEHDDSLDAIVRPQPIRLHLTARTPAGARAEGRARVQAIRTLIGMKGTR